MLNNFHIKLIACITMFIDHLAICLVNVNYTAPWFNYPVMRGIGRMAFVLFAYLLASGAFYTRNKTKYIVRLFIFAIISEIPFNLVLYNEIFCIKGQNIYFTLLFGLICIFSMQKCHQNVKKHPRKYSIVIIWGIVCIITIVVSMLVCQFIIRTDYGAQGILCIAVFGLANIFTINKHNTPSKHSIRKRKITDIACCALCVAILVSISFSEIYSILAIIPIILYNYKKGYSNKIVQISFYAFYPVHLIIVYCIAHVL